MRLSYIANIFFSLSSFAFATIFCYLDVVSNDSLLGGGQDAITYFGVAAGLAIPISLPLLIGSAWCFSIEAKELPWLRLLLVALGAGWSVYAEPGFIFLLIYPFNIATSWALGFGFKSVLRKRTGIPIFIITVILVPSLITSYALFSDQEAERRARSFCSATKVGEQQQPLEFRADSDLQNITYLRTARRFNSFKEQDGSIHMLYTGINRMSEHYCEVVIVKGEVVEHTYVHKQRHR